MQTLKRRLLFAGVFLALLLLALAGVVVRAVSLRTRSRHGIRAPRRAQHHRPTLLGSTR